MKRFIKTVAVILAVLSVFSLTACGSDNNDSSTIKPTQLDESAIVMRYGDLTLNEKEYMYIASMVKNIMVLEQQQTISNYTGAVWTESEILNLDVGDGKIFADLVKEQTVKIAQQLLIVEKLCADSNVKITEQSDLDDISEYISDIEYAYGGTDLFEIALVRMGFTRSGIERYERFYKLYQLLYDHRYGENGVARVPDETVNKEFKENYLRFDGCIFGYIDEGKDSYITYEFTDDAILEYYNENYVKVRHILYKTTNDNKDKKKAEAEVDLQALLNGTAKFEDLKKKTDDNGYEYLFTYDKMVEPFEKAAFEMNVGDIRLVETEYGYHIVEKLEKTELDLFGNESDETVAKEDKVKGIKSDVITAMSMKKIRDESFELLAKLQSGEIEKYPEETSDKAYYYVFDPNFINKNSSDYKVFIEILSKLKDNEYSEKNIPGEGSYILRRLSFSEKDITTNIYTAIYDNLAGSSFSDYISSYYDSVDVDNEILKRFDVLTIPMLEEEFYTEY